MKVKGIEYAGFITLVCKKERNVLAIYCLLPNVDCSFKLVFFGGTYLHNKKGRWLKFVANC